MADQGNQTSAEGSRCWRVCIGPRSRKSHKEVWALKIKSIVRDGQNATSESEASDGSAIITPEEEGYAPFRVDREYVHKHNPQVGGYYVVYEDGYQSFSPAQPFEAGNTLVKETTFLERLIKEEEELGEKILKPDDIVVLYTDGLIENINRHNEFFSVQDLMKIISENHFVQLPELTGKIMDKLIRLKDLQIKNKN
jgi:hypothetical protein